jgi:hypothetical protein
VNDYWLSNKPLPLPSSYEVEPFGNKIWRIGDEGFNCRPFTTNDADEGDEGWNGRKDR